MTTDLPGGPNDIRVQLDELVPLIYKQQKKFPNTLAPFTMKLSLQFKRDWMP